MNDDKKFDDEKLSQELHDQIHRNIRERIKERFSGKPPIVGIHFGNRSWSLGLFWGVVVTLLGVIFLLNNIGVINAAHLWRFWPLVLVIAGLANIFDPARRVWGVILMVGGTFLQLNELGIAHFTWAAFWPMVLIAVGLMVLWNSLTSPKSTSASPTAGGDPRTTVVGAAVFSGLERRVTTQDFQGGNVTAIFGGIELDLSEANMQADEATLEVTAIFGGAEIRVPYSWQVSYRGAPVFGGVEDKTRIRASEDVSGMKTKVLNITGAVIFGGLEIKN
jgi:predicted membrane protein